MTADLSALIARLEAAEVGSRELDRDVAIHLEPKLWLRGNGKHTVERNGRKVAMPRYTTSTDAALALAEMVLPEVFWEMSCRAIINGQKQYGVTLWPEDLEAGVEGAHGHAPTPAIALVIAILRAKQGEGE